MNKEIKFKIGDKIKGISDMYNITNKDMYLGEIKEVGEDCIKILILEHKNPMSIGETYYACSPEGKFEIVESKNRKFFKKLPNDFTGTLEVENGYIVEKEILDDVEKEYLKNVIKPFRNRTTSIGKGGVLYEEKEFIYIETKEDADIILPYFKKNTMYKGMEAGKRYTLEELGL